MNNENHDTAAGFTGTLPEFLDWLRDHLFYGDIRVGEPEPDTWDRRVRRVEMVTGGFSDDERLLGRVRRESIMMNVFWRSTHAGGLYVYEIPMAWFTGVDPMTWLPADKPEPVTPPDGWFPLGAHANCPWIEVELSGDRDEEGLPLWERPTRPSGTTGQFEDVETIRRPDVREVVVRSADGGWSRTITPYGVTLVCDTDDGHSTLIVEALMPESANRSDLSLEILRHKLAEDTSSGGDLFVDTAPSSRVGGSTTSIRDRHRRDTSSILKETVMSCPNCDHVEMIENDRRPGSWTCGDCGWHEER